MKAKSILVISVLANVALLASYVISRPGGMAKENKLAGVDLRTPDTTGVAPSKGRPPRPSTGGGTNGFNWGMLESEDYRQYIANLRAISTPEETIRDIIIADVSKLYARRIAALYPPSKDFKYWRAEDRATRAEDRKRDQKRHELEDEKRALLKELLGIDYQVELTRWEGRPDQDERSFGFLSPEKQAQFKAIDSKYDELERALFREGGGATAANRSKLEALRKQREAELAQALGPEDYKQYELRNSPTAESLRQELASFQPTEDEMRKIFDLRKKFDDEYGFPRGRGDDAWREQRKVAQQQMSDQIKGLLGEQRWQDYNASQDPRYREVYDFAQRNELAPEAAKSVFDMQRAAEEAQRRLEADPNMSPEARQAALVALAEETRRSVATTMGDQAMKDYVQLEGRWIDKIAAPAGAKGPGSPARGVRDRRR